MSILSQIDAGKTLSHPLVPSSPHPLSLCSGLAISKMSTYQAPGSLLDKGIGPGQGVTGRDGWQGERGTRIRAKTMRISINKEAKRRQQQQRQWVWLQQKQTKKKTEETEAKAGGGQQRRQRRRHHLSNTHTQRSSKVLSLQLSRQTWPRQQSGSSCSFDVDIAEERKNGRSDVGEVRP